MNLQIDDLVLLQAELDQRIFTLHKTNREDTLNDRLLALLVEMGELANETRCFKYWSVRPASSIEIIAQEYGDGLHFLLSLGIDLLDGKDDVVPIMVDHQLTNQFIATYKAIVALKDSFNLVQYRLAFGMFVALGSQLGLTHEMIRNHYLIKNKTNHTRQDNQY